MKRATKREDWPKSELDIVRERLVDYKGLLEKCHEVLTKPCNMEVVDSLITELESNDIGVK